jgi:YggT family protein
MFYSLSFTGDSMSVLQAALLFLCQTIFTLCIIVFLLRFCLQLSGIPSRNLLTQWLGRITNPVLKPLRYLYLRIWKHFDSAAFIVCLVLIMVKVYIYGWIRIDESVPLLSLLIFSCGQFLQFTLQLYSIAIIAQAVLSWVNPGPNALSDVLYSLTAPMLNLVRRFIPPIAGFDLSPIPVWLALQLLNIMIAAPIMRASLWML